MSVHGLLIIDKPGGITSREAVDRCKGWFPRGTPLGHTGSLDPLATGVLVVCVGVATRLADYVQRMPKTYRAGFILGATSDTDDADGVLTPAIPPVAYAPGSPSRADIERELQSFLGEIDQVPPAFSAVKVTGRRAYALARRGWAVELTPRRVRIDSIEIDAFDYPRLDLLIRCGKGTYIRSLARDLGERLGCGAYVATLRRTRIGPFVEADALSLDAEPSAVMARLQPLGAAVAELPKLVLPDPEAKRLRLGQRLPLSDDQLAAASDDEVAVFDAAGTLLAVSRIDRERRVLSPGKVVCPARPK
jgi:tRNA pseudouridine55 synthase